MGVGLPQARSDQVDALGGRRLRGALDGRVPGVVAQLEGAPVDGEEGGGAQILVSPDAVLGDHVDGLPGEIVAVVADLDEGEIEGPLALCDLGEVGGVAGVARVVDAVLGALDHPGRPQRGVSHGGAARVVAGRGAVDGQTGVLGRLPPVELVDLVGRHLPALEMGADAQPHEEVGASSCEVLDGGHVEVIEVVVGDGDHVDRGQVCEGDGGRVEALGRDGLDGEGVVREDGVGHEPAAVELDEHGGVAKPGGAQAGRGGLREAGGEHREGPGRLADLIAGHLGEVHPEVGVGRRRVVREAAVLGVPGGGLLHARQPLTLGRPSEVRPAQHVHHQEPEHEQHTATPCKPDLQKLPHGVYPHQRRPLLERWVAVHQRWARGRPAPGARLGGTRHRAGALSLSRGPSPTSRRAGWPPTARQIPWARARPATRED